MLTEQVWRFLEEVWNEGEDTTNSVDAAVSNVWSDQERAVTELVMAVDHVLNCEVDEIATEKLIEASEPFAVGALPFYLSVMRRQLCDGLENLGSVTTEMSERLFLEGDLSLQENIAIIWGMLGSAPDVADSRLIEAAVSREDAEERHSFRCVAAQTLGKIKSSSAAVIDGLAKVAIDADEPQSLRAYCVESLMDIGPSAAEAIPALRSIQTDDTEDEDLRNFAWAALKSVSANSSEHPCGGTVAEHMRSLYETTTHRDETE
ncbi:MAG: hypothetical protein ABGZ53_02315 [Fuerstiella sp.]